MRHGKTQGNELYARMNLKGYMKLSVIFILVLAFSGTAVAQVGNGSSTQESKDTNNNADQNLKSIARINPSTLAMEFSLPFMSYPGRNGNSMPIGINYSSKMWRMETGLQWWYKVNNTQTRYVTDIRTIFAEHTMAGWTSSLAPPKLVEKDTIYDESGSPYRQNILNEIGLNNHWQNVLSGFVGNNNTMPCGTRCTAPWPIYGTNFEITGYICLHYELVYCDFGGGNGPSFPEPPPPTQLFRVKQMEVTMPDGSTHEFRKDDSITSCGNSSTGCSSGSMEGMYLSVDGSGMKIKHSQSGTRTLYLPNGSRYEFPSGAATEYTELYSSEYIDADGNKRSFLSTTTNNVTTKKWTDTMGREIIDPLSHQGTQEINLPGLGGDPLKYEVKWERLKPSGCEANDPSTCTAQQQQLGGALEDQTQKLYYETRYFCRGNSSTDLLTDTSNPDNPVNEVLFPHRDTGIRPCNSFNILRDSQGQPILDGNGSAQPYATRFNPPVLSEIRLPNGKKYIFKYNRYGEISKIIYPTGSYETFSYGRIAPMNGSGNPAYDQTNRGVTERRIYSADNVLQQRWQYSAEFLYAAGGNSTYKITTKAPKGNDPLASYVQSERFLYIDNADGGNFGFSDPRAGMPKEERIYAENDSVNPRSRTLTKWITKDVTSNYRTIKRDARVEQTISVAIENGQAIATLNETEYETPGESSSSAPPDPEYFAHLNVKRAKGYHYAVIPLSTAQSGTISQIASYFNSSLLASVSETDYQYSAAYKDRGIASLPVETRVLNPQNLSQIIARTQTLYDEYGFAYTGDLSGNLINTWIDPATDQTIPPGSRAVRGKATTVKIWDSDNNAWIQTRSQYDKYGNVRKVWEPNENILSDRFAETEFSADYGFAYPTKVKTPAPSDGTYGTDQGSTASTTYDFMTGLPITAKNDFNQTTKTEYDTLLRPVRTYGDNFIIPETQTVYNDDQLWVKVRKQLDANNWDEATTFSDSLGRTIKTQSKDSQGDVFVETQYDFLGRVTATSNPYRQGDAKYWSKPRYDELGRAVEAFAPAQSGQTGASLGTTEYGISTMAGYVGTIVTTTDAAGKKARSFTNGLGQLIRVDEPDYTGGLTAVPQGSPNPSPTPNTSPTPVEPPTPSCSIPGPNCLNETDYPSRATIYRYNAQGKMVEVVQGAQHRYFKYDSLGRLIRVRQPEQQVNNSLDSPDDFNTSGKWTAKFTYDVIGNVLTSTDANGTVITYSYDKANRVKTRTYSNEPNGMTTPAVSYYYDGLGLSGSVAPREGSVDSQFAKGKLTKVTSSVSETRYTQFDYLGRLLQSEQRTPLDGETIATADPKVSSYKYNFSSALIKQTYPSNRVVENAFESDGDLSRIYGRVNANAVERTYANSFSYMPDGRIEKLRLGNHRWEWAKFNERLQVTELNLGSGVNDASLWKLKYEYGEIDANGNVDAAKNTGNIARQTTSFNGLAHPFVQTFKYDSLYRLKEARETTNSQQTWKQNFSYDRYGNRIGYENFVGTSLQNLDNKTNPSINPQTNRFNTNQGYSYDFNGNLVEDAEGRSFTFNGDNKQTDIKNGNINVGKYFYDGEGKRVKKVTNLETVIFVYDGLGKIVAEYSTKEPPTNPTISYTATDQLGSPRVITDSQGNVTSRRDFQPFGEELFPDGANRTATLKYGSTDGIRQKFTSYQRDDETLLDFAEARMYENRHARFTAVDPLLASGKSANPQTFNRYIYVMNNPVRNTDPTGLQTATDPEVEPGEIWVYTTWIRSLNQYLDQVNNYLQWTSDPSPDRELKEVWTRSGPNLRWAEPDRPTGLALQQFNKEMEKVDSVMQYEPTGIYNAQKSAMMLDRGQGSYSDFALQTGLMGANILTLPTGGGVKKQAGREIALGLETLAENSGTRFVLRDLAETTGGTMAKFWADEGITRRTINNRFGRAFNQATERADTIHFALDGLIDNIPGALDKGRRFGFDVGRRNVTNAELYTVYSNPTLFNKTRFYLNNRLVEPPANPYYVFR